MLNITASDAWAIARKLDGQDVDFKPTPLGETIIQQLESHLASGGDKLQFIEQMQRVLGSGIIQAVLREKGGDKPPSFTHRRGWFMVHFSELDHLPPIEYIIAPDIPERGIVMLFGSSGTGKTFKALDYALRVAQDAPIVYVAGEGEYGYRNRRDAWCKHNGLGVGAAHAIIHPVPIMELEEFNRFRATLATVQPRLVVLDTLAMSMTGYDENSNRDMGIFVDKCKDLRDEFGCAVLIVHHTTKEGIWERGGGALRAACDVVVRLSADDDLIRCEIEKNKEGAKPPYTYLKLLQVALDSQDSCVLIDAGKVIQTERDPLTTNQRKVLDTLAMTIFEGGAAPVDIADQSFMKKSSVGTSLNRLLELGYVNQQRKHGVYQITETGRDKLKT